MEDIIDIIVTETTNTIEITAQPNDEIIDVNIIDNREDIVLNVTPTVVEININSLTSNFGVEWGQITGTLSNQTDLNNALALKANLVGGKVPASELPSYVDDVVEVATFSALPATGEIGKIYVILDTNKIYRWSGSVYVEIADSTAVWGAITGTLSSQTDLQNALNAKFDDPTGDTTQYIAGDGSLIAFPVAGQAGTLVREVRNTTGATLTKGTIVYISGATGNKPTVSKAIATGDSTSAQTFGMCQANIANNSNGYVVCVGDLGGLDTSGLTEGAQLYLSSTTAGTYTTTKQLAPNHLVYIGVVTRAHPTQGQIEVNIQNGYELNEIHDVAISSLANNDGLFYESSTDLWKNKSIATVLGYTPANGANYLPLAGGTMTGAIVGTTATFAMSGSGIALGVTGSGTGDAIRITHSSGRALTLNSSGSGFGILINNDTASTSAPFTIQKTGASVITLTDAGAGTFNSSLTASSFIRTGGTSAQFLKANGSVDSTAYQAALTNPVTGTGTSGIVAKFNGTSTITDSIIYDNGTRVSIGANVTTSNTFTAVASTTSAYAVVAQASGAANGFWAVLSGTGEIFRGQTNGGSYFIVNNGGNAFLNGNLNIGDFGSTSFKLNVIGTANITGALSGTSATFSSTVGIGTATSPAAELQVGKASDVTIAMSNSSSVTSGNRGTIAWYNSSVSTVANIRATAVTDNVGTGLEFYTRPAAGSLTKTFDIASTGAATFSSIVNVGYDSNNRSVLKLTSNAANRLAAVTFYGNNIESSTIGYEGGSEIVGGGVQGDFVIRNVLANKNIILTTNNGNVGIGTTAPTGLLHITGADAAFRIQNSGTGNMQMGQWDGTNNRIQSSGRDFLLTQTDSFNMLFHTNSTERMRITSGGNVVYNKSLVSTAGVNSGDFTLDTSGTTIFLGALGAVNIGSFSGMVLVTNTGNGVTMLFLCGGGFGVLVSQSTAGATGTMTNFAGSGYTFTTAATFGTNYSFQLFRTRVIA